MKARVRVINMDGSVVSDKTTPVSAKPSSAPPVSEPLSFRAGLSAVHFVKTELLDAQGRVVSDNFYWRGANAND